jgi:ferrous iron transport protein B
VTVTVVDASNLSAGLHLVAQIAEAGLAQVVALNMWDVAQRRNATVDVAELGAHLGLPVVPTVARRGEGVVELVAAIQSRLDSDRPPSPLVLDYGPCVELHLARLEADRFVTETVKHLGPVRWTLLQLLAGDERTSAVVGELPGGSEILTAVSESAASIGTESGYETAVVLAERRFAWVAALLDRVVGETGSSPPWSDRLDRFLTYPIVGLPVFLAVMWVVLRVTADVTAPFLDWVGATVAGPISRWAVALLSATSLEGGWVEALVVDGLLAGVGGVLVFVPVLFGLYLMLALLEDSGYLARAAMVMDRAMRAVGIPGKAFLPMMVGFGCTVPAIAATRTLDSSRDRLLTGLLTPFMSCGARLPVYVLLAGVFFAPHRSTVVFAMYLLGIVVAVMIGLLLSRTVLRDGEPTSFVMVLPDFRLPNARTVWSLVARRTWAFIKGAGTVILVASVAVWLLLAIPVRGDQPFAEAHVEHSAFGALSEVVAPALRPLGFGEWEQSGALASGFVAKEVVVSTLAQLYAPDAVVTAGESHGFGADLREIGSGFLRAAGETAAALPAVFGVDVVDLDDHTSGELQSAIRASFEASSGGHGAAAGLAFMVFVLLYTPCMAAIAAFRHEFGTRWMWVSVIGQTIVAWAAALVVFQGSRLVGLG